jgi:hypothetical protein
VNNRTISSEKSTNKAINAKAVVTMKMIASVFMFVPRKYNTVKLRNNKTEANIEYRLSSFPTLVNGLSIMHLSKNVYPDPAALSSKNTYPLHSMKLKERECQKNCVSPETSS